MLFKHSTQQLSLSIFHPKLGFLECK